MNTAFLFKLFGFVEPKILTVREDDRIGQYRITPLKEGFGNTIGNALRRSLLSSLPGAAITELRIDGVSHEFSTLSHVREDVLEIVLNLKKVCFKMHDEQEVALIVLDVEGERVVKARDFSCPSHVDILNPDVELFHLTDAKASVYLECKVERGLKFLVHENADIKRKDFGVIPIDAIFSPVLSVSYEVQPTRVGKATNYDELIITVETNGAIEPKEAVLDAAKLCAMYFQIISQEEKFDIPKEDGSLVPASESEVKVRRVTLEDLQLSTRTKNSLVKNNISSIDDILSLKEEDLLSLKNFGKKSLIEIKEQLTRHGIEWGGDFTPEGEPFLVNPEEIDTL